MKLIVAAATAVLAAWAVSAQVTTTAPPAYPVCTTATTSVWLLSADAKNCTAQTKYSTLSLQIPKATTFETFCPNPSCRSMVANVLNSRPPAGDCVVIKVNISSTEIFSKIIDPFAKACEITAAPITSKPPVTTAPPPTTTAPAPGPTTQPPTPTPTRPACA